MSRIKTRNGNRGEKGASRALPGCSHRPATGRTSSGFSVEVCWARCSLPACQPGKVFSEARALPSPERPSPLMQVTLLQAAPACCLTVRRKTWPLTRMKPVAQPQASKTQWATSAFLLKAGASSVCLQQIISFLSLTCTLLLLLLGLHLGIHVLLRWGRQQQLPSQTLPRCLSRPLLPSPFLFWETERCVMLHN